MVEGKCSGVESAEGGVARRAHNPKVVGSSGAFLRRPAAGGILPARRFLGGPPLQQRLSASSAFSFSPQSGCMFKRGVFCDVPPSAGSYLPAAFWRATVTIKAESKLGLFFFPSVGFH